MIKLTKKEMLKEMSKYGFDEQKIKLWYNDTDKEVTFDEYIEHFYYSDVYRNE